MYDRAVVWRSSVTVLSIFLCEQVWKNNPKRILEAAGCTFTHVTAGSSLEPQRGILLYRCCCCRLPPFVTVLEHQSRLCEVASQPRPAFSQLVIWFCCLRGTHVQISQLGPLKSLPVALRMLKLGSQLCSFVKGYEPQDYQHIFLFLGLVNSVTIVWCLVWIISVCIIVARQISPSREILKWFILCVVNCCCAAATECLFVTTLLCY